METIEAEVVDGAGKGADVVSMDRSQRMSACVLGCALIGLLLVAGWLKPSSTGQGTHQQLGLPPCTFIMLFNVPCPTCGMTTSWSHFMRGDFVASWNANPGGLCLAILSASAGIWGFFVAIRGKYVRFLPSRIGWAIALVITAITLVDWAFRIF